VLNLLKGKRGTELSVAVRWIFCYWPLARTNDSNLCVHIINTVDVFRKDSGVLVVQTDELKLHNKVCQVLDQCANNSPTICKC
jgi:hypothetical protein